MKKITFILLWVSTALLLSFIFNSPITNYTVDTKASQLKWTGYRNIKSMNHTGYISLKSGTLTMDGEKITGGHFVIDMNSIKDIDLKDEKDNAKLVDDLKSENFFYVKEYPEARLVIKNSEKKTEGTYKVSGDITVRGITKQVGFDVKIDKHTDSGVEATADFELKRKDFDIMDGFNLKNAVMSGDFTIQVKLVANK